jgi:hypothetical protein
VVYKGHYVQGVFLAEMSIIAFVFVMGVVGCNGTNTGSLTDLSDTDSPFTAYLGRG